MNIETGKLVSYIPTSEQGKYIPVTRDLSAKERADMQIQKYALCGCGSGKKFKFCCYKGDK
jgi:uncharacterized protein YchJ